LALTAVGFGLHGMMEVRSRRALLFQSLEKQERLYRTLRPKVQALLGIPKDHAVCAIVPLGKPVKQLSKLKRRTVEEIATRERFDGKPFGRP